MATETKTEAKIENKTAETVKAAADTARKTAEKAQAASVNAFRDGMDRSLNAMGELTAASKRNLEAAVESATAATRGFEALNTEALAWGKKSWEDGVNTAQALASARSVQEVVELQTAWAKSASEAYMAELNRMTEIMTASVKDTFRPINERMTATVERFQAAR
ncbi:TIGR01841 family phasin [Brevundimonas sp. 2R-24]|uniref:TIGR01841 family phasin n=1 Tax=Peiella sedimenti TaxID=3061083 RepID=A0ABT8SIQ1_9CAUL|nr:TIGR01841 family phasin [Caulobacteraceae bacterium XZ-24]